MSDLVTEDILQHYGKLGMKWGHRSGSTSGGTSGSSTKVPWSKSKQAKVELGVSAALVGAVVAHHYLGKHGSIPVKSITSSTSQHLSPHILSDKSKALRSLYDSGHISKEQYSSGVSKLLSSK